MFALFRQVHYACHYYHHPPPPFPYTLNALGSSLPTPALLGAPSNTHSAMRHPVPGPFWIPQHVCPAATHTPGTDVGPTMGPRSWPKRMWRGR